MRIRKVLDEVGSSLWFVPALWVVACGAAAFGIVAVDDQLASELAAKIPFVFGGGPEGARGLLSAIASSTITVVGVVFSITIVALQLASAQYSPRVLRNFMRDRPSQMTLGSFIGAFVYSLLVLRTVRSGEEPGEAFVPVLAVTGAVLLAIVAVALLVFYIHHIATRMQVSHIVAVVADETLEEIDRQAEAAGRSAPAPQGSPARLPDALGRTISAARSGYLQYVEIEALCDLAEAEDIVIALEVRPGTWVQRHAALFRVWGERRGEDVSDRLRAHVTVGTERVVYQDPEFGIRQLVDIGVKALSPGINDPTTARSVLHRLVEVLVAAGRAEPTPTHHFDERGTLRVVVPQAAFEQHVRTAFEEIHHFGRDIPSVARTIIESLDIVEATVSERHRPMLDRTRRKLGLSSRAPSDG